jgi:predicted dinucleotide-binding enzyme
MKITILGAGNIGGALGRAWTDHAHEVLFGVRNVNDPTTQAALRDA